MKLDRAKVLQLVTAIASSTSCRPEQHVETPVVPLDIVPVTTPSASPSTTSPPPRGPDTNAVPPPAASSTPARSPIDDYDPTAKHSCAELSCPDPTREGMRAIKSQCATFTRLFRPEYNQRFVQCLLRQNRTRAVCDLLLVHDEPGGCLEGWNRPSTIDPSAKAKCAPVVATCAQQGTPLAPDVCESTLTVTSASYERKMLHCIAEGCSATACYFVQ